MATVGMNPSSYGISYVFLTEACGYTQILHELGHILGLQHEMTRLDRDAYVKVHESRVRPAAIGEFKTSPANDMANRPYDPNSIMHYRVDYFKIGQLPTIEARRPGVDLANAGLEISDGDIASLYALYKTEAPEGIAPDAIVKNGESKNLESSYRQLSKFSRKPNFTAADVGAGG